MRKRRPASPFRGLERLADPTMLRPMRRHGIRQARAERVADTLADHGFTVVELLVTMGLLLLVVTAITGTLVTASNQEANLNTMVQSQTQARQALSKLTREIHCANVIDDLNGTPMSSWTGPVSGITVTLPAGCPTGGACAVTAKWYTQQSGSTYDLYRSTPASTCESASNVRWATFLTSSTPFSVVAGSFGTQAHFPLVGVDLSMNAGSASKFQSYALSTDVAALNATRS